jgi:hypothetical protein
VTIRDQASASPGAFFDALEVEDDEVMIVTLLVDREDATHLARDRDRGQADAPLQRLRAPSGPPDDCP